MDGFVMYIGILMIPLTFLWSLIDFVLFLGWGGRRVFPGGYILEVIVLILPFLWLLVGGGYGGPVNEWFKASFYVLMIASVLALFYSSYRKELTSPALEVTVIFLLLCGISINVWVIIRLWGTYFWIPGCVPLILQFVKMLIRTGLLINDRLDHEKGIPRAAASAEAEIPQDDVGDAVALPGTGI